MDIKKIIFMGTPKIAENTLQELIDSKIYKPSLVFTQKDKPVGRKKILTASGVKILAEKNNIEVFQPETMKDDFVLEKIKSINPDLIVVFAYGQIIPQSIIDIPKYGILNVHTSLLPKYRGASPIQNAILNGDEVSGVTIMQIDKELDHGPILAQKKLILAKNESSETLHEKFSLIGADLLLETIPLLFSSKIEAKEQKHEEATFTNILKREDGKIIKENTAIDIDRMFRAFTPWPGIYLTLKNKNQQDFKLKLLDLCLLSCEEKHKEGIYLNDKKELILKTKNGCLLLRAVQPESKQKMSGISFYQGYKDKLIL